MILVTRPFPTFQASASSGVAGRQSVEHPFIYLSLFPVLCMFILEHVPLCNGYVSTSIFGLWTCILVYFLEKPCCMVTCMTLGTMLSCCWTYCFICVLSYYVSLDISHLWFCVYDFVCLGVTWRLSGVNIPWIVEAVVKCQSCGMGRDSGCCWDGSSRYLERSMVLNVKVPHWAFFKFRGLKH